MADSQRLDLLRRLNNFSHRAAIPVPQHVQTACELPNVLDEVVEAIETPRAVHLIVDDLAKTLLRRHFGRTLEIGPEVHRVEGQVHTCSCPDGVFLPWKRRREEDISRVD